MLYFTHSFLFTRLYCISYYNYYAFKTWKVGRAVEGARLEYVFALCVTRVRIPDLPDFCSLSMMMKSKSMKSKLVKNKFYTFFQLIFIVLLFVIIMVIPRYFLNLGIFKYGYSLWTVIFCYFLIWFIPCLLYFIYCIIGDNNDKKKKK